MTWQNTVKGPSVPKPPSPDVPELSQLASERTVSPEHRLGLLGLSLGAVAQQWELSLALAIMLGSSGVALDYRGSPESGHQGGLAS